MTADNPREGLLVAVGAVVAVLLQVVLAPNIVLFSAMPNFMLAYALVLAILRPASTGPVLAFLLGLAYDLLGAGPVGAMAFLLVAAAFLTSRIFLFVNNDTAFMPLALIAAFSFAVELGYALFMMATGAPVGVGDALLFRVVPCALYDCVVGFILFPLVMRLLRIADADGATRGALR